MSNAVAMNETESLVHKLNSIFSEKQKKNPAYSIRSFSRLLDMDSGTVSRILAGKRVPSATAIRKIKTSFHLLQEGHEKENYQTYRELTPEEHLELDRWQVSALQEATLIRNFNSDPKWIAEYLGITVEETEKLIEFLISVGHLARRSDGRLYDPVGPVFSPRYESDEACKARNVQNHHELNEVANRQYKVLQEDQYSFSSYTVAADRTKVESAKKMIADFRRQLGEFLGHPSSDPTDVYVLKIDLFPVGSGKKPDSNS